MNAANELAGLTPGVLRDRAMAAIVGIGVGDVLGDLGRDHEVRSIHGIVSDMLPGGRSTDDTEFCVLSARSLLDCAAEYNARRVAEAWRRLVIAQGGMQERAGIPLYGAMWNLAHGIDPPLSGIDNVLNDDDGAAMRSVPFGIAAVGDPDEAARLAAIDASISHFGDGIDAASAIAASASVALKGASVDEIIETGTRYLRRDSWLGRRMELALEIVSRPRDRYEIYAALHSELWTPKHSIAAEAIPQVYGILKLAAGDFKTGLVMSANFGRDADTICALVTSLTAARFGMEVFPGEWVEQVRHPSGVCLPFAAKEDLVALGGDLADWALRKAGVPS